MFSVLAGLVFILGLLVMAALSARYILTEKSWGREVSRGTLCWTAPYPLMLLALALVGFVGLIDGGPFAPLAPIPTTACIVALSQVTLRRDQHFCRLHDASPATRRRTELLLLAGYALLCLLMVEEPYSWAVGLWGPTYWWLEIAILMGIALFFYLVSGRHGSAVVVTVAAYTFIGIAQYFVRRFKNSAILPNDLLAISTAAAVGDQYTFSLDPRAVIVMAIAMAGVCVLSLLHPGWTVEPKPTKGRVRDLGLGATSLALTAALVLVPNYMRDLHVEIMYWYSINFYEKQGFLPTFIAIWQDMPIHKPEGYTPAKAQEATKLLAEVYEQGVGATTQRAQAVAQFEQERPSVIVVMNESFADLSVFDELHAGYKGPQFFKNLDDALWRGKLAVSVQGGGTCNSEFEFLSGNSLGYIGAGKYPYSTFDLTDVDSVSQQLKDLGYATCAIHPNYPSNWNRHKIYPAWGFDTFLSIDDFGGFPQRGEDGTKMMETPTGVPVFHSGVSDQATYERIIEMLETDSAPQFVFDVTMQNHGSYNQNNIPEDKLTHYLPQGIYDNPTVSETPERLNEYLSCIEESDRALEWFVGALRELDRPVVLVFFGDHQPSMTPEYNDAWYTGEDDTDHAQRIYHSDYLVWANYDVAGQAQVSEEKDTSVDVLASLTLNAVGAPLSTYEQAQLAVNQQITAINLYGYRGVDGEWYTPGEDSPYSELYEQMALVEYLNFAERV